MPVKVSHNSMNLKIMSYWFLEWKKDANIFKPYDGSRILIHNVDEFPSDSSFSFNYVILHYSLAEVTPELTLLSSGLKSQSVEKRNCFFNDERPLRYFKVYSKENCKQECGSLQVASTCGCVPFYLISKS
jgi:acid-sensing ion channel, other